MCIRDSVEVARPEVAEAVGGGQQGAAGEGAGAEQGTAGDERDEEQEEEEHRGRPAGDPLEPGELLDLQVVGVVAAGTGLDGAVPSGGGGLGGGASGEVAGDLFDGGPYGRAGWREQGPQFAGVRGRAAAFPACGEDRTGAQQGADEAGEFVEGLAGDLADEVGEDAQQGAEDDAQGDVREQGAPGVGQEGVDGAGLVDAVGAGGGAADAVDGAAFAGGGLGVPQDGVGGDEDLVSGGLGAPAQVDVVAHQGQTAVEAAQLLVHVAADEHARAGDGQDGPYLVVLALVLFAAVQAGPTAAAAGDADACFEELAAVVPAAEFGTEDGGRGAGVGDAQQFGERVGFGGAVVVQQPQPLDGFAVREFRQVVGVVAPGAADRVPAAGAAQVRQVVGAEDGGGADGLVDGGAEAGAAGEVEHPVVAEGLAEQPGGGVRAAGVGAEDLLRRAFLAEESGEDVGEPAFAVVGDEYGGDDVPGELG